MFDPVGASQGEWDRGKATKATAFPLENSGSTGSLVDQPEFYSGAETGFLEHALHFFRQPVQVIGLDAQHFSLGQCSHDGLFENDKRFGRVVLIVVIVFHVPFPFISIGQPALNF
jgi:hypothetical protein